MPLTVQEVLKEGTQQLLAVTTEAALEARLFLQEALSVNRAWLIAHPEEKVSEVLVEKYMRWIDERLHHKPLQLILGEQEFMELTFKVNEATLIPRRETEELVSLALEVYKGYSEFSFIDIGTGTGCIAISLCSLNPLAKGLAIDFSGDALEVAKRNAVINQVEERLNFLESDLLSALEDTIKVDLIISNPPYIPTKDIEELMPEVKVYEPITALDGGEDGLIFYRRISKEARNHLKCGGYLMFEIGYDQKDDVCEILKADGYQDVQCLKDLSQRDRMIYARYYCL